MNKKMTMRVAAFAAFAVCVALPLCAAELTHRWSFNGDWADSAGGADAAKCGTYVSLYGGRVHMGYVVRRGLSPLVESISGVSSTSVVSL